MILSRYDNDEVWAHGDCVYDGSRHARRAAVCHILHSAAVQHQSYARVAVISSLWVGTNIDEILQPGHDDVPYLYAAVI